MKSLLSRILNLSVNDPKAWDPSLWRLYGSQSLSGEHVTEDSALTYSAVWNAVTLIAGTVSTLPLNLISRKNGKTIVADTVTAHRVLHEEPNEYMTAMTYREVMMAHLLLWGNCYSEIVRDGYGNVVALWPLTPNRVHIKTEDGDLYYEIRREKGETVALRRDQVLHVPGLGFDGLRGYSVVGMARRSIGLGMAMESFGSLYFGQGTHPGVVLSHPGKLSPEGHKNLEESLRIAHSGLGKSHRLMLLEEAMKIEKVGIEPEDSQFLESRQFQIPEIARWFNLPPHKLKDLSRSSFNNIESEQISFVTDSILPWLIRLEQNYNIQLLTRLERKRLFFKHTVEGLLRGSAKDRAIFYRQMWSFGAMSQNEIREKEDMDPIEGGDEYFVPMNMQPLSRALKEPEPQPVLVPSPEEEPAEDPDKEQQVPENRQVRSMPGLVRGIVKTMEVK